MFFRSQTEKSRVALALAVYSPPTNVVEISQVAVGDPAEPVGMYLTRLFANSLLTTRSTVLVLSLTSAF